MVKMVRIIGLAFEAETILLEQGGREVGPVAQPPPEPFPAHHDSPVLAEKVGHRAGSGTCRTRDEHPTDGGANSIRRLTSAPQYPSPAAR